MAVIHPTHGTAYQSRPLSCSSMTGAVSASVLLSPSVMNDRGGRNGEGDGRRGTARAWAPGRAETEHFAGSE